MVSSRMHHVFVSVLFLKYFVNVFSDAVKNEVHDFDSEVYDFDFFMRDDWKALPSSDKRPLKLPAPYVVIHHTPATPACYTLKQCGDVMRALQKYHINLKYGDIGFNFCVGSEGGVFEGRGWNYEGIHTESANIHSIGICLIGNWNEKTPPKLQLDSLKALLRSGVALGELKKDYKLIGHNQIESGECPGEAVMTVISTWEHFVPGRHDFGQIKKPMKETQQRMGIAGNWMGWGWPNPEQSIQFSPWYNDRRANH